ncbi:hypothetical protein SO802_030529 [Lithocarpus litseifolius]|uniref:RNase H type-1 domain-containing protein n=1 Tax=Lithocarpus litseifolius TaxID=425828 RepID=A0AAW2BJK5_9ROSI
MGLPFPLQTQSRSSYSSADLVRKTQSRSSYFLCRSSSQGSNPGSVPELKLPTSVTAELCALRDGLKICIELQLPAVVVEMDALLIINMISGASVYSKRLSPLVDDCRALFSKVPHAQVQHCYGEANAVADPLARHGATKEDDFVTLNSPPIEDQGCGGVHRQMGETEEWMANFEYRWLGSKQHRDSWRGGGLIRDENGDWVTGFARMATSFLAEYGLSGMDFSFAYIYSCSSCFIELDAKAIVDALNSQTYSNTIVSSIMDECRHMVTRIPQTRFRHIYREANKCAKTRHLD